MEEGCDEVGNKVVSGVGERAECRRGRREITTPVLDEDWLLVAQGLQ